MSPGEALFRSKGIWPGAYQSVLNRQFGTAWLSWEPETLWTEIKRIWQADPSGEVRSKILAIRVAITTDLFYSDAPAFENMVLAINDLQYDPGEIQLASPEELVYALRMLGPLKDGIFSREVTGYIRACCRKAGLVRYPDELRFAEPAYPAELAQHVKHIKVKDGGPDLDPSSVVDVQSDLLYRINIYVANKMAQMSVDALAPSTA
jgi:hypothetical protein